MSYKPKKSIIHLKILRMLVLLTYVVAFGQKKQNFQVFDDNYSLKVKVNDTTLTLKFDTGASKSALNRETLNDFNENELVIVSKQDFSDGMGNIISRDVFKGLSFSFLNLNSKPAFIFDDFMINDFLDCRENIIQGILGLNIFFNPDTKSLLSINHDDNTIGIVRKNDLNLVGFKEVGADFRNNSIYIDAEVGGKYVELLFDTGYEGYIMLRKRYRKLRKYNEVELYGNTSATLFSLANGENKTLEGVDVEFAGIKLKNNIVSINPQNSVPILGSEMIKKFNWLIDFKNEKLFLQKRQGNFEVLLSEKLKKKNVALAVMGKIYVISSFQKEFKPGTIITSINNENVTPENICEKIKLLQDNNRDWTALNIN